MKMEELTLRSFDLSDIDDLMTWLTDDQVSRFCRWDTYTSREDGLNYMKDVIFTHPWFKAICLKNKPIGAISVAPNSGNDSCRAELGYVLATKYWGQDITTQAVKMVVGTIISDWPHFERLEALVDVLNIGSQKVLEKAGFQREGVLRKYFISKGSTRDVVMYSFLNTDPKLD